MTQERVRGKLSPRQVPPRLRVLPAASNAGPLKVRPVSRRLQPAPHADSEDPICTAYFTTPRPPKRRLRRIFPISAAKKTKYLPINPPPPRFSLSETPKESLPRGVLAFHSTWQAPTCDDVESMGSSPPLATVSKPPETQKFLPDVERATTLERSYESQQRTELSGLACSSANKGRALFVSGPEGIDSPPAQCNDSPLHLITPESCAANKSLEVPDCNRESSLKSNVDIEVEQCTSNASNGPSRCSTNPAPSKQTAAAENSLTPQRLSLRASGEQYCSLRANSLLAEARDKAYQLANETPPHFSLSMSTKELSQSSPELGVLAAHGTLEAPTFDANQSPSQEREQSSNYSKAAFELRDTLSDRTPDANERVRELSSAERTTHLASFFVIQHKHADCNSESASPAGFNNELNKNKIGMMNPLTSEHESEPSRTIEKSESSGDGKIKSLSNGERTSDIVVSANDADVVTPAPKTRLLQSALFSTPFLRSQLDFAAGATLSTQNSNDCELSGTAEKGYQRSSVARTLRMRNYLSGFQKSTTNTAKSDSSESCATEAKQSTHLSPAYPPLDISVQNEYRVSTSHARIPETPATATAVRGPVKRRVSWSTRRDSFPICTQVPPGSTPASDFSPYVALNLTAESRTPVSKSPTSRHTGSASERRQLTNSFSALPTPTPQRYSTSRNDIVLSNSDDVLVPETYAPETPAPDTPCAAAMRFMRMHAERSNEQSISPDATYEPSPDPACAAALRLMRSRAARAESNVVRGNVSDTSTEPPGADKTGERVTFASAESVQVTPVGFRDDVPSGLLASDSDFDGIDEDAARKCNSV